MLVDIAEEHERLFQDFIAKGNQVVGRPARIRGNFRIFEYKSGSKITFGPGVTISGGTFQFPLGGGEVHIGKNVTYASRTHVGPKSVISIGDNTKFNRSCELHAWEGASISIGRDCLFSNIKIRTSDLHSVYDLKTNQRVNHSRSVMIEDRVWLAEGVVVCKGTRINAGSVIGSYSVVTGHIGPNSIAVGVPAKVVKTGIRWDRQLDMTNPVALPAKSNPTIKRVSRLRRPLVPIVRQFVSRMGNKGDLQKFDIDPAGFFAELTNPRYRTIGLILFPPK